ncbi:MAG: ABC transporter ATP-binding protein [Gammaproteobacteria bacterium]
MTRSKSAIISVESLCYEYPGRRALDNVTFDIAKGSITALVGPNGAGKTTLLRCLAGMDRPLGGAIDIAGIDVVSEPRKSHRVSGYLSDFFGLYETLSVRQSLTYVARANRLDSASVNSVVESTATDLGMGDRLEQTTATLSRGLRQRVAIAQAIIHRPEIVLLDEPASGLDPEARFQLGELFLALQKRGMTLVVSSHILAELESYSSHMLILGDGRIIDHRNLRETDIELRRIEIRATEGMDQLEQWLQTKAPISDVQRFEDRLVITLNAADYESARLLKDLVDVEFPITHFAEISEDLQQSYLHSIADSERRL